MAKSYERVFDGVYGYIHLRKEEFELVTSPIFQRLQWIKQLGPLHTIFPSAQHSRFSHSLGVFHIVVKMIKRVRDLEESMNARYHYIKEKEEYQLRFAALLHDIGHVPLSHVGEFTLEHTYRGDQESSKVDIVAGKTSWRDEFAAEYRGENSKLHECLSAHIVRKNPDIRRILESTNPEYERNQPVETDAVAQIIIGKAWNPILNAMLHSELDADRLDYLLRDSYFTGVGYGHIDLVPLPVTEFRVYHNSCNYFHIKDLRHHNI